MTIDSLAVAGMLLAAAAGAWTAWRPAAGGRLAAALFALLALLLLGFGASQAEWQAAYQALVAILAAVAFWVSPAYVRHAAPPWPAERLRAYFVLLGLFVASMLALGQRWPLLTLWIAVEATTLTSVALVAMPPGHRTFEAAWKYLLLAGFGGLLALCGLLLIQGGSPRATAAGVVLLLVGFGTKAGLVPFHTWLPDAHAQAPAPVSALLSGAELAGVLWVLQEALGQASTRLGGAAWPREAMIALGLVSLAIGVGALAAQRDLKRMLAYSSIEHMGVIAVGIGFGGVALLGAMLHVITHGLAKAQGFYAAGAIQSRYDTLDTRRIGQLHRVLPWTGGGMLLSLAALAGVPPLGPFWSEWLVALGGLGHRDTLWAAVALIALLAVGFFAIAHRVPQLWYRRLPSRGPRLGESVADAAPPVTLGVLLAVSGLLVPVMLHWHPPL